MLTSAIDGRCPFEVHSSNYLKYCGGANHRGSRFLKKR